MAKFDWEDAGVQAFASRVFADLARVSGYSACFGTLSAAIQDAMIARSLVTVT